MEGRSDVRKPFAAKGREIVFKCKGEPPAHTHALLALPVPSTQDALRSLVQLEPAWGCPVLGGAPRL